MKLSICFSLCILAATPALCAQPPAEWRSVGVGGGGGLFAPSFSPHNPAEIFVACDMGEQFHSTDAGASWKTTPFTSLQTYPNSPKVQFTDDPRILYMIDFTGEKRRPVKSTDGGKTWRPLPGDPTDAEAWNIIADPTNSNRVLVSSYSQLFVSNDGGTTFAQAYGTPKGVGLHLAGAFFDGNFIALGTSAGLLVSENGGAAFAQAKTRGIPSHEAIVSFAAAASGATTRFFCVTLGRGDVYPGVRGSDHACYRGVYVLERGGSSWRRKTGGITRDAHPFFVAMARNNPDVAYLGGSAKGVPIIYKTVNGGNSWRNVLLTQGNRNIATGWSGWMGVRGWGYGELVFGLDVNPRDSNRVAFTDMGFIHLTTDGGESWRQAYVDPSTQNRAGFPILKGRAYLGAGLENTSVWHLAWADANTLWASFTDIRGIRSTDGGWKWSFDYTGHRLNTSYQVVVHPKTGVMYMAASSIHDLYQSTYPQDARIDRGKGDVLFSTDKGRTWWPLGRIGKPVIGLALDPTEPNRLYASVVNSKRGGIYVCDDITAGDRSQWTRRRNPPRTEGHPFNVVVLKDGTLVCTFSGRRAGKPLKFTPSSGLFVSADGGRTWQDRSHPNMHYWTKDITIDPHDASQKTWYVGVFSGWGGPANNKGGLYRTANRGQSWEKIFDNNRVSSCTVNPRNPDEMYVTTEVDGLRHSHNLTSAKPTFTQVASYPFRQPERVFFNPYKAGEIWITSFGNGLRVGQERQRELKTEK